MQSFKIKETEFKCRTQFCGKELSFAEDATNVGCDKCKKRYTIKKKEGDFVIYYEKYPIYPFSVLAEKYKLLRKKHKSLSRILDQLYRSIGVGVISGYVFIMILLAWYVINNVAIPQFLNILLSKGSIDLSYLATFISLLFILFVLYMWGFTSLWTFITASIKKPKLDNSYLSFGLALSILLILTGYSIFSIFLGPYFPVSITLYPDTPVNITVKCISDGNMMLDPVYGNNFLCGITIENKYQNVSLNSLKISDYDYSLSNLTSHISLEQNLDNLLKNPNTIIPIPIGKGGRHTLFIISSYTNQSQIFYSNAGIEYVSLSREEYNDKQYKRLAFLFGLFSIAIFSVFSAMNNIKSILER